MDHSDDVYYDDYPIPRVSAPIAKSKPKGFKPTITFVVGIIAIAILMGFSFGLYSADSLEERRTPSLYDEQAVTELFETASPAIVEISVQRRAGGLAQSATGTGSGFLVDAEGHIVTNHHVVASANDIFINLSDGRRISATLLGSSPADDLAILKVDTAQLTDIPPLTLANSDTVRPGQMAVAIGSPFRNFNSVTVGVVSGTGRGPTSSIQRPIPDMIQTDAALNPGNSGGPLLNSHGQVIGVNSAVRTGNFQGLGDYRIGFAVPSNTLKTLMPELLTSQTVRRPWLGISGGPISQQLSELLGVPAGIVVTRVFPQSPAMNAGLVPFQSLENHGDVIVAVNDRPVNSVEDMVSLFNRIRPGNTVTLVVVRKGETITLSVTLAEWPDS